MGYEPSRPFVTSVLELKLDTGTMFDWQKHTSSSTSVPHFTELLEFINLCAQASELDNTKKPTNHEVRKSYSKPITSFAANASPLTGKPCPLCKTDIHPLFSCTKFKSLSHDHMIATVKENKLCINCLRPEHFSKQCKSLHKSKSVRNLIILFFMLIPLSLLLRLPVHKLLCLLCRLTLQLVSNQVFF